MKCHDSMNEKTRVILKYLDCARIKRIMHNFRLCYKCHDFYFINDVPERDNRHKVYTNISDNKAL